MVRLLLACAAALICGCANGNALKSGNAQGELASRGAGSLAPEKKPDTDGARHAVPVVVYLDVFKLTLPVGAVSQNDEFWKHIDEDRIDIATYDVLYKNGVRVGVGHNAEWKYFKGLLGQYPGARSNRGSVSGGKSGYVELEMHTAVQYQNIFWLNDQNALTGHTYEKCDDLLAVSYQASTHRPGEVLVKVCPMVRGLRHYFPVTILNNEETELEMVQPEQLYDLRLEAVLPLNDFLIIAPSKEASLPTSLGSTFLHGDGKAEPLETVLVIVPKPFRSDDPLTAGDAPTAK